MEHLFTMVFMRTGSLTTPRTKEEPMNNEARDAAISKAMQQKPWLAIDDFEEGWNASRKATVEEVVQKIDWRIRCGEDAGIAFQAVAEEMLTETKGGTDATP
jgi:hypothetical protein